jgi:hypothetical protein
MFQVAELACDLGLGSLHGFHRRVQSSLKLLGSRFSS